MANYNLTQTGDEVQAYIDSIPVIDVTGTLSGSTITFGSNPYSQIAANYAADCGSIVRLTVGSDIYLMPVTKKNSSTYTASVMIGAHNIVATITSSAASATIDAGIDTTPTQGSNNLVKSGGVYPLQQEVDELEDKMETTIVHTKNLADYASVLNGLYPDGNGFLVASVNVKSIEFPCKPSTTYTITKVVTNHFRVAYYNATPVSGLAGGGVITRNSASSITITTASDSAYIVAYVFDGNTTKTMPEIMASLQIEEGSVATPYETPGWTAVDKTARDGVSALSEIASEKKLAVLHNGLPMMDKEESSFSDIRANAGTQGRTLSPILLSNFLLDMHFDGTPTTGCNYVLRYFNYAKNGNEAYSNSLSVTRINADNTSTTLALYIVGATAPKGLQKYDIELQKDVGVTSCHILVDWDALLEIDGGQTGYSTFNLINGGYVFNQSYLFGNNSNISSEIRIDKLENDVIALQEEVGVGIDLDIPSLVYAISGTELNIWNDAIALSADRGLHSPLNYQVRWSCNKGTVTDRCFRYTPTDVDAGNDYTCTCYVYNNNFILLAQKSFTIRVKAKNTLSAAKNIAFFGDSLGSSSASALYNKFHDSSRFTGTAPMMVGTRGTTPKYEAVGGFRWVDYATSGTYAYRVSVTGVSSLSVGAKYSITIGGTSKTLTVREVNLVDGTGNILLEAEYGAKISSFPATGTLTYVSGTGDASISFTDGFEESGNPLWNDQTNQLDVAQYKNLCGLQSTDKIDAVSFQFGINDTYDANTITGYISDLYNAFIADNADCKFIVALPTICGNDVNGWGANYGAGGSGPVAYKKKIESFRQLYISLLNSGNYPNMRIATPGLEVDRYYGYAFSTRQISQETTQTEEYHNNAVHPGTDGYKQIGDSYLAAFVAVLTES